MVQTDQSPLTFLAAARQSAAGAVLPCREGGGWRLKTRVGGSRCCGRVQRRGRRRQALGAATGCKGRGCKSASGQHYGVQTDPNGLLFMRARYYNPYISRFLNPDPSAFGGGLNFYLFCNGNPISETDPFGLCAVGDNNAFSWVNPLVNDLNSRYRNDLPTGLNWLYNASATANAGLSYLKNGIQSLGDLTPLAMLPGFGIISEAEAAEESATLPEGSFSIADWVGYPANLPKPTGPFRLLEGAEYDVARGEANSANAAIHEADPSLNGLQLHEIQPVKFGGSPTDPLNKIPLTPQQHIPATTWWNQLLRDITP